MIRRGISTIVLLGYLAGQLAFVPHAHAGAPGNDGHCWQTHVHVSASDAQHRHGHDHCHYGDHCGKGGHHHADDSGLDGNGMLKAGIEHDADAVYVSTVAQARSRTGKTSGVEAEYSSPQAYAASNTLGLAFRQDASFIGNHRVPDTTVPHCALYLSLRTLRI